MIANLSYRKAFYYALALHLCLIFLLLTDTSSKRPVLTAEAKNTPGIQQHALTASQSEPVKAVSVDQRDVMDTVNRIKEERAQQIKEEQRRQNELKTQAETAKQQRIKEQNELAKLKEEANTLAIARKKQAEEEKKRLKQLAQQQAKELKQIEALKKQKEELVKQKELEAKKRIALNKKKAEEAAQLKANQAKAAEKAHAAALKQQAQALAQANAEQQARLAGEVDKYKALIVNAIGRNWILPEHADSGLSSQFRIRLAPDGMVLAVTLTRSSGDPLLDRSAQTAIYKASPLPVPTDAATFNLFRDISLTVRPEQVRG